MFLFTKQKSQQDRGLKEAKIDDKKKKKKREKKDENQMNWLKDAEKLQSR